MNPFRTFFFSIFLSSTFLSAHQVMSWISPYAKEIDREFIQTQGEMIAPGLTRIGLQFWGPTTSGGVVYVTHEGEKYTPNDSDVEFFRDWAHNNQIAVLLCIYNNNGGWNWPLASQAFKANGGETLANALIAEMERLNLDGIDLDLEGNGEYEQDRAAYNTFVQRLSAKLKERKKILTIDTFHSPCYNAPNTSWWKDWVGLVDNIHTMGYEDLYEGNTKELCGISNIFKYSTQQRFGIEAGLSPETVVMGLPTNPNWGFGGKGTSVLDHIREVQEIGTGIAIWEVMGMASASIWQQQSSWDLLKDFKGESCGFHPEDPICTGKTAKDDDDNATPIQHQTLFAPTAELLDHTTAGVVLQLRGAVGSGVVELYQLDGRSVEKRQFSNEGTVQLGSQLQRGLYLLRVKGETLNWSRTVAIH